MSKEKKQTKTNKVNWNKAQLIGFYSLIAGLALFFSGVYVGTQTTLHYQAQETTMKAQAVEEYKASLKANQ